jgi:hypothetical protein
MGRLVGFNGPNDQNHPSKSIGGISSWKAYPNKIKKEERRCSYLIQAQGVFTLSQEKRSASIKVLTPNVQAGVHTFQRQE